MSLMIVMKLSKKVNRLMLFAFFPGESPSYRDSAEFIFLNTISVRNLQRGGDSPERYVYLTLADHAR